VNCVKKKRNNFSNEAFSNRLTTWRASPLGATNQIVATNQIRGIHAKSQSNDDERKFRFQKILFEKESTSGQVVNH